MTVVRILTGLVVAASLWIAPSSVLHAQEDPADAFYIQAVKLFNEGRYRESLEQFDKAIELRADPIFYCNRAAVEIKLQEMDGALASLRQCRDLFEGDRSELGEINAEISALEIVVELVQPDVRLVAGRIANPPDDERPDLPAPIIVEDDEADLVWYGALATGGVAVVSLTAALVLDVLTQPIIDDFEAEADRGEDRRRYDDLKATIDDRKVTIGALVGVGVISAAASGVLFYFAFDETNESNEATGARVDIVTTDGGLLLGFTGRF